MSLSKQEQARLYEESMQRRHHVPPAPVTRPTEPPASKPLNPAQSVTTPGAAPTTQMRSEDVPPHVPLRAIPPEHLARRDDVETSKQAARAEKAALRITCIRIHAEHPEGLVDDDLGGLAGKPGHESYRRRGGDLRALGWTEWLIVDGKPVTRKTAIGGTARVSVITAKGREVAATGVE